MNKKHKKDIKRIIQRNLGNKSREYFFEYNKSFRKVFMYRFGKVGLLMDKLKLD